MSYFRGKMIMFAGKIYYIMKRFYYITFLAALAVVCLQASYIYHLYETYKEEKVAEMHRALKTAINDELVYNTWEGIDKGLIAEKLEELAQQHDSSGIQLPQAGMGETMADVSLRFLQDARLYTGFSVDIQEVARYFSGYLPTQEHCYALHLLDKDKHITASVDSLQGHRANYTSELIPLSDFELQYLRLEAAIPPSDFILQNVGILAASLLLMLTVLLCVALQLGKIRRQANVLQRREDTINGTIHDLKSPLNSVIATLSWIAMGEGSEAKRKALDISRAEVKHLVCNIESLLVTVRKDRHRLILKKEAIDLPRLAEIVKSSLDTLYQAKPHSLQIVNRLPSGIRICADGMYIESVLRNLVENALKYADDGVQVQVTLSATEREAQVDVQDNGWGIAPRYQRKLFRQFYQVPRDEAHTRKGYGIGLAQAKYIIDEHKGRISVQSAEGKGSTFSFRIPLA